MSTVESIGKKRKPNAGLAAYQQSVRRGKRDAILKSAMLLFCENGFERTNLASIANHAGVSIATLYSHFKTKAELLEVVVSYGAEAASRQLEFEVDYDAPIEDILLHLAQVYGQGVRRKAVVELLRLAIGESPEFNQLGAEVMKSLRDPSVKRFKHHITQLVKRGQLATSSAEHAAVNFIGLINQFALFPPLLALDRVNTKPRLERLRDVVAVFYSAYGTDPEVARRLSARSQSLK